MPEGAPQIEINKAESACTGSLSESRPMLGPPAVERQTIVPGRGRRLRDVKEGSPTLLDLGLP